MTSPELAGYPVAPLGFDLCSQPAPLSLVFTARDRRSLILGQEGLWEGAVLSLLILRTTAYPVSLLRLFQNVCKPAEETQRPPTLQEIKQKIDSYNTREKNCLGMKLVRAPLPLPAPGPRPPAPAPAPAPPPPLPLGFLRSPSGFWGGPSEAPPPSSVLRRPRGVEAVRDPACCGEAEWALD